MIIEIEIEEPRRRGREMVSVEVCEAGREGGRRLDRRTRQAGREVSGKRLLRRRHRERRIAENYEHQVCVFTYLIIYYYFSCVIVDFIW